MGTMVRRRLLLAAPLLLGLTGGCVRETDSGDGGAPKMPGEGTAPPPEPSAGKGGKRLKIAVVPKGTTHEFWQTVKAGADAAGKELDVEILWNGPKAETDIQDQIDILNGYATQGVDGVAMAATDKNALVQTVKDLEGKKIPVVTIDSGIEPDESRSFIATDNVAAAGQAAKELGRLLGGKGKVAVLPFLKGAGTSDEREKGFLDGIKEFAGIQVVAVEYSDSDTNKAADKMETILTQHPDLAGVFAASEPNVNGAARALDAKKLGGKVKLVGFDASKSELEYLKSGVVQALVVQDPFKMGYEGVKALVGIARGTGAPEKRVDTGATVVTAANMSDPKVDKLLHPLAK
jgi:ribose transport system substrate-binding protein